MRICLVIPALIAVVGCTQAADTSASAEAPKAPAAAEAPAAEPVKEKAAAKIAELDVEQLDALLTKKDVKLAVFDANGRSTREEKGVIPTATLLDSSSQYDLALLPEAKDTKLVFYCGSTSCSASDTAAERATTAGYSDVCVLRPGIAGWAEAGKKTVTLAEVEKAASATPKEG